MKTNRLIKGWKQWFTAPPEGPFIVTAILSDSSSQYLEIGSILVDGKNCCSFKIKIEHKLFMRIEKIKVEDTKGNKTITKIPDFHKYSVDVLKDKYIVLKARISLDGKEEGPIWRRALFET